MDEQDLPLCTDEMSRTCVDAWFDFWIAQSEKDPESGKMRPAVINKLRRLALCGLNKARRNKRDVDCAVAAALLANAQDFIAVNKVK